MTIKKMNEHDLANTVLENAGALIVVLDNEGRILKFNRACEKLSGFTFSEVEGKFLWDTVLLPEDAETIRKNTFDALTNNPQMEPIQNPHHWVAKNGNQYLLGWITTPMFDVDGQIEYIINISTDNTERHYIEDALRQREAQFQNVIDASPVPFALNDEQQNITYLNPAFVRTFGYDLNDIPTLADWWPRAYPEAGYRRWVATTWQEHMDRAKREGTPFEPLELNIQCKDGTQRTALVGASSLTESFKGIHLVTLFDITERKRVEKNLRETHEKLKISIDNMPNAYILADTETRVLEWNKAAEKIFGYSKEELLGKNVIDFIVPEKVRHLVGEVIDKLKVGDIADYSEKDNNIRKDGKLISCHWYNTPLADENGKVFGILFMAQDITERIRAEHSLAVSEERFRLAVSGSNDGIWDWDVITNDVYFSPRFIELLGYSEEDVFPQKFESFESRLHPNEHDSVIEEVRKHLEERQPYHSEFQLQTKNGSYKWFYARGQVIWDKDGVPVRMSGSVSDITERKQFEAELEHHRTHLEELVETRTAELKKEVLNHTRVEEALRESEQRLHAIMDTAVEGIITINHSGIIESFNSSAEKLFGYSSQEMIGKNISLLMKESDSQQHNNYINNYLQTGEAKIIGSTREVEGRHKNGTGVQLELSISELKFGDRKIFTGILHDISERKQQEHDLREATANAEKANKAKSEFLASMSHELRTPMNAILGFGQLLRLNPEEPLTASQEDYVEQIMSGGKHLLELINGILDLARIEAGKVELSFEAVEVKLLIDKCLKLTETIAQDRNIQLIRKYEDKNFLIHADVTRTQQILLNILSNAIKYNRAGGMVKIDCAETQKGILRINITDTGHGIPPSKQDDIFQPFNRLGIEASNIEGTGIGLTVSKNLVELMGGNIGFESKLGKGSTFWIELPLSKQQVLDNTITIESLGESHEYSFPKVTGTLLYVEDNPESLKLMESIIANVDGLTMIFANTAELGIEMARTQQPDIIILDINLPGMNGIEALGKLNELEETAHIPVFALSASASQIDINKGLEAGFQHYLTKPLKIKEMIDIIKGILDARPGSIH